MAGPTLNPGQVAAICGRRGGGKTLLAAHFLYDAHKRGAKVFHNGPLKFGEKLELETLMTLDEKLMDSWILLDEVQNLSDSQRSGAFVTLMLSRFLTQIRKRRCTLIWTSQDEGVVDRRLNWQTDIAYWVRSPDDGKTVFWDVVDFQGQWSPRPSGAPKRGEDTRKRRSGILRRASTLWPLFDSLEVIDPYESMLFTKENLLKSQADSADIELLQTFSDWISQLAASGTEDVAPGELALQMASQGYSCSPEKVGKMLKSLGFAPKRSSKSMRYQITVGAN